MSTRCITAPALRPVVATDHDLLAEIYASTRREEVGPLPWTAEEKESFLRSQFEAQLAHYTKHYDGVHSIIEVEGEPAGRLWVEERASEIRIVDIALLPRFRGQGIGGEILRDIQAAASQREVPLRIHVERENPARRLYARLGFRTIEDKGVYELLEWRSRP